MKTLRLCVLAFMLYHGICNGALLPSQSNEDSALVHSQLPSLLSGQRREAKVNVRKRKIQEQCDEITLLHKAIDSDDAVFVSNFLKKCDTLTIITELLHRAAIHGSSNVIKVLFDTLGERKEPFPVDALDIDGATPLYRAIQHKHTAIISILLKAGASLDSKSVEGVTLLHFAIRHNHLRILDFLLAHGANPNAVDDHFFTPLYYAAKIGNLDAAKILIQYGVSVDGDSRALLTPLYIAAQHNHQSLVYYLLSCHPKPNIEKTNDEGKTLLHLAAENGHEKVCAVLCKAQAHLDARDYAQRTPLHLAAASGSKEVVDLLLKADANIETVDQEGYTPLHWAAQEGHTNTVAFLLEKKANKEALKHKVT